MAVTYFLTIDGVDGGSVVPGHAGAFEINDFDVDVSALVSAIGGAAGKATFSPLTVDLTPDSGLTTLLDDAASGKIIKSIELKGVTSDGKTVYDLQLSNVVITDLTRSGIGGGAGTDSLSFDYSQGAISLTTTPLNQDGTLGTPVTASWNVAENKADATIAPPVPDTTNTGGGGAQTYFLTVDGVDGGSAVSGHAGAFEISDYSFDVNAVLNDIAGAGGTAGKATFPPLTVTFAPGPGLTSLLEDAASGRVIKSIELEGVLLPGGTPGSKLVYDLQLSNVVITDLASSGTGGEGGSVSLSFDYNLGAISLTTTPLGQNGSLGTPSTMSWDVAENKAGGTIAAPVVGTTDTGGGGAQKYFLTIDGVDGGSIVTGHAGAFLVKDYSFDLSALVDAIGGRAGKATFSPLTVDFAPTSGLTSLLSDAASGKVIKSIELEGVTSDGNTVYDLLLSNVVITALANSGNGDGSDVSLSFDYNQGAISLTTTPRNQNGSLGAPTTVSWDVTKNAPDTTTIAPPIAAATNTGGGGTQTYFLTIDGVDGGSAVPGYTGAFEISDYSFDVSAVVNDIIGTGGAGGTTGKSTFKPLTVDFKPGSGLTSLLEDAASGKVIKSIDLQGVVTPGGTNQRETVYDLQLSNVVITKLGSSGTSGDSGAVSLSLDYSEGGISLTTTPRNQDGSLGTPVTVSWDVAESKAGATIAAPIADTTNTGGAGAQKYFLTIDGVDGGALAVGHTGAFVIDDYSFDVTALVDTALGKAGKATFSPLTVDFAPDSGLTSLLRDAASGKVIKSIELKGVTANGATVYDLTLGNVVITDLSSSGTGGSSGVESVSFNYGAVSLTTTPINQNGSPGTPVTVSWDVAENKADTTIAPPVAGKTDTGGGGTQTYFLTIDGIDGDSAVPGHTGAFEVNDYSFDVSALAGAIGTGGAAGKSTFSPLKVSLAPDANLTSLLADAASGKVIKSIELQGVATPNGTATKATVYDLKLTNVVVTNFDSSGTTGDSGLDKLSFDYSHGTVTLTTTPIENNGALGIPSTLSWDVANNKLLGVPGPTVTDTTTPGEEVAHDKTIAIGTVTPGSPGDTLTLTELTGPAGAVTLADGVVSFAAPAGGDIAFSYQISDQNGNVSAIVSDTLTVDPGPGITDNTTPGEKVVHDKAIPIGTVTPGLPGDTLTLTELTGPAGAVTLSNGIVSFAAPASGDVAFSYQISDQLGDVSAVVSDTLTVDPGPSVTDDTTPGEKIAHGTTVAVGSVTPGLPGDTLTLSELTGAAGAVTLNNGVVSFAAPADASGDVAFSYQISDQLGDVSAVVSDTLEVDPGPKAGSANLFVTAGERVDLTSLLLSLDTPGLPGDTLALTGAGTAGTRGTVALSDGDLVYTAPANGTDMFTYTVSDQLHETATAGVDVSVVGKNGNIALAGTGNIVITTSGNRSVSGGTGGNFVSLGDGNDTVSLGGNGNTVLLGDGNDSVTTGDGSMVTLGHGNDLVHTGANSVVTAGDGNDTVTAGAGSTIRLGNGNDLVYAGANSSILFGKGNDTVFAGSNDTITLGTGHDLVAFGLNPSPLTIGNEIVKGFGKDTTLEFNRQLVSDFKTLMSDAKQLAGTSDTVITFDANDSVTLRGVAVTSLKSSNFKFS